MAYYDLEGTGSSIQSNRMGAWANDDMIQTIYDAIQGVETGGLKDKSIRTMIQGSGSSAYGPLQLTSGEGSMMQNLYDDPDFAQRLGINEDELYYVQRFLEQGDKFLEPVSDEYKSQYGYGGSGELNSPEDQALYDSVSRKLINYQWHDQAKGDPEEFIKKWHVGTGKQAEEDWTKFLDTDEGLKYRDTFMKGLGF